MSRKKRDRSWPDPETITPLPLPVTDQHCHLPVPGLPPSGPGSDAPVETAELVRRATRAGVTRLVTSACEMTAWAGTMDLARALPAVRVAASIHPNEAAMHAGVREVAPDGLEPHEEPHHAVSLDEALAALEETIRANRDVVVAVGESGLDYFRTGERGRQAQRDAFRAHIALAKDLDLPLQIHDRDAHADCVEVLLRDGAPQRTVFHCFSGGMDLARICRDRGWFASIAGPVTYLANEELREAVASLPLELLMVETDAPYLPPRPWRGRPNGSYLMGDTVRFLAQMFAVDVTVMCERLACTTDAVYGTWDVC